MSPMDEALRALPHGPEFRFLDRMLELEPGVRGVAEYTPGGDEPFLRGHFPGAPILPGVLLIEAAAQLAGVVAQADPAHAPMQGMKLAAVRHARIHGTARPGETVRVEATLTGRLSNVVSARVHARVGDLVVLECEVTLAGASSRS
jgi:3-hydroxyacyl-[acyl-carrier-protein] dehydratase